MPIKNKTLHMNSTSYKKITTMWRYRKWATSEKVSQSHSFAHTLTDTHAHTHKHTYTMHTWTPSFYCFVLYSYQETSAKLNDHHKEEVTCCDIVIVLEDVHIFVLFFEVQKHLVTHV